MYDDSENLYTDQIDRSLDRSLTNLIKAQKQIEWLSIHSDKKLFFSDDFKEALLIHSKSITRYCSRGGNNIDSMLIPKFTNLNSLTLSTDDDDNNLAEILRSSLFRDIKDIIISLSNSSFLLDISNFIKINGKNLSFLMIWGNPSDVQYLENLIQSIGENCQKLRTLTIPYNDEAEKQLFGIFNNCIELYSIDLLNIYDDTIIDADKVLAVLNQTLPRNLKSIYFRRKFTISDNSLEVLMNNWKGPKPLEFELNRSYNESLENDDGELVDLLKKYEDLGFLEQIHL